MAYILLLSTGVICSICFQANGHCTTPECTDASEGIDEILVTTSVMLSGSAQEKGQCTTSACEYYSTATDETVVDVCQNDSIVCDCSDIKANGYAKSGVYRIYVFDEGLRYYANASCDMTTTNGAWTMFQRRKDGSVDFYRVWNEYASGFGDPSGEFWLGNNFLHLLSSKRRYRLRIDLEDFEGEKRYAEYSTFNISSSADKYTLTIGSYSGNAGDGLTNHNGQRFSTKDNDNDAYLPQNCAEKYRGAWWYNQCAHSSLNGLYLRGSYWSNGSFNGREGIGWYPWHWQWYSLKTTELKISSS